MLLLAQANGCGKGVEFINNIMQETEPGYQEMKSNCRFNLQKAGYRT